MSAGRVILRPTRSDDLQHVIGEPLPYRIWAITGELDGRVLGVGGLTFFPDHVVRVFMALAPDARRYKVSLYKAARIVLAMAQRHGYRRVVALADQNVEAAERFLVRLGFEARDIDGTKVFIWLTPSP